MSHWYARSGSVPATTTVVCATSSPSGPTAAVRTELHTFNAEDNPPLSAVNDAMGSGSVERMGEWQGPVPG